MRTRGLFQYDGACRTRPTETKKQFKSETISTTNEGDLECCLNCKKKRCGGDCATARAARKAHKNKNGL